MSAGNPHFDDDLFGNTRRNSFGRCRGADNLQDRLEEDLVAGIKPILVEGDRLTWRLTLTLMAWTGFSTVDDSAVDRTQ